MQPRRGEIERESLALLDALLRRREALAPFFDQALADAAESRRGALAARAHAAELELRQPARHAESFAARHAPLLSFVRLLHIPLRALERQPRMIELAPRRRILGVALGLEQVERAAVLAGAARRELDDAIDAPQQLAVMADGDEPTRPRLRHRVERVAALGIEVVRGLVEDEQVGPIDHERGERHARALAAAQARERAIDRHVREREARELGVDALAQVPAIADSLEIAVGWRARERARERGEHVARAERIGDGAALVVVGRVDDASLRQVADARAPHDLARCRRELAEEEANERALPDPVRADESRALAAEAERQVAKEHAPIGKREAESIGGEQRVGAARGRTWHGRRVPTCIRRVKRRARLWG